MHRKSRDASAAAAKAGDKSKSRAPPKVAVLKRSSATASSSLAATTELSNPSGAAPSTAKSHASGSTSRKRPTKLRAPRERRARDRSMDADEDLEHKFSNLSVAAPAFVPGRAATDTGSKAASSSPSLLNGRSLAFVTERGSAAETQEKAASSGRTASAVERRPRRQRIGALGFANKPPGSVQGRVTRQTGASAGPSLSLKPRLTDESSSSVSNAAASFTQRPRSDSAGSDSDYSSDDEVYPEEPSNSVASAFPDRLTLFAQQKHIPKKCVRVLLVLMAQ